MNQSETIGKLTGAVCAVVAERGYVKADARNDHFKYNYLSDEAVLGHVRGSMAKNGLMLVPNRVAHSIADVKTNSGKAEQLITTTTTYVLAHISGEWMEVQIVAQGQDKADKGPYKAATGALKYALRNVFLIPTGDDPEKARQAEQQARKAELGIDDKGHTLWFRTSGRAWIGAQLGGVKVKMDDVSAWSESLGRPRLSGMEEGRVRNLVALLITPDSDVRRAFDGWLAKGGAS